MSKGPKLPNRPYIPALFYACVTLIACNQLFLRSDSWLGYAQFAMLLLSLAVLVWQFIRFVLKKELQNLISLMALSCLLSLVSCYFTNLDFDYSTALLANTPISKLAFKTTDDSRQTDTGYRTKARLVLEDKSYAFVWLNSKQELPAEELVFAVGRYRPNKDDEWGRLNRSLGIAGTISLSHLTKSEQQSGFFSLMQSFKNYLSAIIKPQQSEGRALLAGILLANKKGLKQFGIDEDFKRAGVAHLIALSGAHIIIFSNLVEQLLSLFKFKRKTKSCLLLFISGIYIAMCGVPVSALRAWLMVACSVASSFFGRRSHSLSGLSFVGILIMVADPYAANQMSFLLSFICVAALNIFALYAAYFYKSLLVFPFGWLWRYERLYKFASSVWSAAIETIASSSVAQLATIGITTAIYGELPLYSIVSNLALVFLFSVCLSLGFVSLCLVALIPQLEILINLVSYLAAVIVRICNVIGHLPFAVLNVNFNPTLSTFILLALALTIFYFWPELKREYLLYGLSAVATAICIYIVCVIEFAPSRFVMLDIGQGDALLVQDKDQSLLIDTGPKGAIVKALQAKQVYHVDAVVLTHFHDDHYGGVPELIEAGICNQLYIPYGSSSNLPEDIAALVSDGRCSIQEIAAGDELFVGKNFIDVLTPSSKVSGLENQESIFMLLHLPSEARDFTFLLTGDGEKDALQNLLNQGFSEDIDVLKMGHHASKVSIDLPQAQFLRPEISIASAAIDNSFGHPSEEAISVMEEVGAEFYCTKDLGSIEIQAQDSGLVVSSDKVQNAA